jgi:penicillin amidase
MKDEPELERADPGATDVLTSFEVNSAWIVFGVISVCLGIGMIVTMSMLLAAQSHLECVALTAIGGVFLPVGVILVVLGVLALRFWSMQNTQKDPPSRCRVWCKVLGFIVVTILYIAFILLCVLAAAVYVMSVNDPNVHLSQSGAPGLTADVAIVRDEHGIAHIEAATAADAVFGQGFAVAQDRLGQLEVFRLAAAGELARYAGSAALDMDKATRAAGFHVAGDRACALLSQRTAKLWQRYADGINFFLERDSDRPPEFMFLGQLLVFHQPRRFELRDLCRIVKLIQFQINGGVQKETPKWELFADVGLAYDDIISFWPQVFDDDTAIFTNEQSGYTANDTANRQAREARDADIERELYRTVMWRFRNNESTGTSPFNSFRRRQGDAASAAPAGGGKAEKKQKAMKRLAQALNFRSLDATGNGRGSNAWAIRSAGGAAVVASDPHLTFSMPSIWYPFFAHITNNGNDYVYGGVGIAGFPGVMIGRNSDVAWGITLSQTDLGDLYVMEPDPSRPDTHYMHNGTSKAYTFRTEVIKVYGGDDVTLNVRESLYGPDIAAAWELSTRHHICMHERVLDVDNTTMDGFANLIVPGEVRSVQEIRDKVFSQVRAPGLSISIGDRFGAVGYALTGLHTIRAVGHTGRMPTYGNGSFDWVADIPFAELPGLVDSNTSSAANISCANQRIPAPGYPYTLGWEYSPAYRSNAIKRRFDVIGQSAFSNVAMTFSLQTSEESNIIREKLGPLFDRNTTIGASFYSQLNGAGRDMHSQILNWNGIASRGSTAPSQLWSFLALVARLPRRALDELEYYRFDPLSYSVYVIFSPSNYTVALCDAATSGGNCVTYAAQLFNQVASRKAQTWGKDLNVFVARNPLVDGTAVQCMFNRRTEKGGDQTSVNAAVQSRDYDQAEDQEASSGPTMRFVMDWSTPDRYYFAFPGGASGNPFSDRYTNLLADWRDNKYRTVRVSGYEDHARTKLKP